MFYAVQVMKEFLCLFCKTLKKRRAFTWLQHIVSSLLHFYVLVFSFSTSTMYYCLLRCSSPFPFYLILSQPSLLKVFAFRVNSLTVPDLFDFVTSSSECCLNSLTVEYLIYIITTCYTYYVIHIQMMSIYMSTIYVNIYV